VLLRVFVRCFFWGEHIMVCSAPRLGIEVKQPLCHGSAVPCSSIVDVSLQSPQLQPACCPCHASLTLFYSGLVHRQQNTLRARVQVCQLPSVIICLQGEVLDHQELHVTAPQAHHSQPWPHSMATSFLNLLTYRSGLIGCTSRCPQQEHDNQLSALQSNQRGKALLPGSTYCGSRHIPARSCSCMPCPSPQSCCCVKLSAYAGEPSTAGY